MQLSHAQPTQKYLLSSLPTNHFIEQTCLTVEEMMTDGVSCSSKMPFDVAITIPVLPTYPASCKRGSRTSVLPSLQFLFAVRFLQDIINHALSKRSGVCGNNNFVIPTHAPHTCGVWRCQPPIAMRHCQAIAPTLYRETVMEARAEFL